MPNLVSRTGGLSGAVHLDGEVQQQPPLASDNPWRGHALWRAVTRLVWLLQVSSERRSPERHPRCLLPPWRAEWVTELVYQTA